MWRKRQRTNVPVTVTKWDGSRTGWMLVILGRFYEGTGATGTSDLGSGLFFRFVLSSTDTRPRNYSKQKRGLGMPGQWITAGPGSWHATIASVPKPSQIPNPDPNTGGGRTAAKKMLTKTWNADENSKMLVNLDKGTWEQKLTSTPQRIGLRQIHKNRQLFGLQTRE